MSIAQTRAATALATADKLVNNLSFTLAEARQRHREGSLNGADTFRRMAGAYDKIHQKLDVLVTEANQLGSETADFGMRMTEFRGQVERIARKA